MPELEVNDTDNRHLTIERLAHGGKVKLDQTARCLKYGKKGD